MSPYNKDIYLLNDMNRYDVQFNVLLLLFCCSIRPRFIIRIEVTLIYILRPKRDDLASIEIVSSAIPSTDSISRGISTESSIYVNVQSPFGNDFIEQPVTIHSSI